MRGKRFSLGLTLGCLVTTCAMADGLVYKLPPDGTWARFSIQGIVLDSAGNPVDPILNITGTLTIGSVGVVKHGDESCRWIEVVIDGQRDGKSFLEVDKLLIPQRHLGAGKQPLQHLRDAWYMHSAVDNGKPRQLGDKEKADIAYVQRVRSILHPPFENLVEKDKTTLACKLGDVVCDRVRAEETEARPGGKIKYESTYVICLHPQAPFGVAAWHATNRVYRKGEAVGGIRLDLTLVDFGDGAKTSLPLEQ